MTQNIQTYTDDLGKEHKLQLYTDAFPETFEGYEDIEHPSSPLLVSSETGGMDAISYADLSKIYWDPEERKIKINGTYTPMWTQSNIPVQTSNAKFEKAEITPTGYGGMTWNGYDLIDKNTGENITPGTRYARNGNQYYPIQYNTKDPADNFLNNLIFGAITAGAAPAIEGTGEAIAEGMQGLFKYTSPSTYWNAVKSMISPTAKFLYKSPFGFKTDAVGALLDAGLASYYAVDGTKRFLNNPSWTSATEAALGYLPLVAAPFEYAKYNKWLDNFNHLRGFNKSNAFVQNAPASTVTRASEQLSDETRKILEDVYGTSDISKIDFSSREAAKKAIAYQNQMFNDKKINMNFRGINDVFTETDLNSTIHIDTAIQRINEDIELLEKLGCTDSQLIKLYNKADELEQVQQCFKINTIPLSRIQHVDYTPLNKKFVGQLTGKGTYSLFDRSNPKIQQFVYDDSEMFATSYNDSDYVQRIKQLYKDIVVPELNRKGYLYKGRRMTEQDIDDMFKSSNISVADLSGSGLNGFSTPNNTIVIGDHRLNVPLNFVCTLGHEIGHNFQHLRFTNPSQNIFTETKITDFPEYIQRLTKINPVKANEIKDPSMHRYFSNPYMSILDETHSDINGARAALIYDYEKSNPGKVIKTIEDLRKMCRELETSKIINVNRPYLNLINELPDGGYPKLDWSELTRMWFEQAIYGNGKPVLYMNDYKPHLKFSTPDCFLHPKSERDRHERIIQGITDLAQNNTKSNVTYAKYGSVLNNIK